MEGASDGARMPSLDQNGDSVGGQAALDLYLQRMKDGAPIEPPGGRYVDLAPDFFTPSPVPGDFGPMGAELGNAEDAMETFKRQGWLPAVIGPYEEDRRRVITRFALRDVGQVEAIDRIADTAQVVFNVPIVVISLVLEDKEIFASTLGWDKAERDADFPRIAIPLDSALCPHRMVVLEGDDNADACLILPDAAKDWRFRYNPYVRDGGPISFFASTNIYLPTAPGPSKGKVDGPPPPRLPVGSLCVVDRVPHDDAAFGPDKQLVLRSLAGMIGREFELSREKRQMEAGAKQTAFLGELFRSQMVYSYRADGVKTVSLDLHNDVARSLHELTGTDAAIIIDLRAYHAPLPRADDAFDAGPTFSPTPSDGSGLRRPAYIRRQSSMSQSSPSLGVPAPSTGSASHASRDWYSSSRGRPGDGKGLGSVSVLGSAGDGWPPGLQGGTAAISSFLANHFNDRNCEHGAASPLAHILPPGTQASLAVPVFDVPGEPALLIVLCSLKRYFCFEPADQPFVENVGAVIIGALLRKRIVDADRAKLAFVSQISHELRTPLHGIGSQVELIRAVCPPRALASIAPLLDVADVCVSSLREILDDTLEFSKMSDSINRDSTRPPARAEVALAGLVEDVVKSCWSRRQQHTSTAGDAADAVDIVLEVDLAHPRAMVDVGGLKRTLFNLIGNALKFTQKGSVRISLQDMSSPPGVAIVVADTGSGMSETFLKEELFVPFRQADSFGSGAGLGVSIADAIVQRMHGSLHFASTLGEGTSATILLPLEFVPSSDSEAAAARPAPITRVLSQELSALFAPPPPVDVQLSDLDPDPVPAPSPVLDASAGPPVLDASAGPLRVLAVDDNPIALRILTTFLKTKRIAYAQATNGLEAVALFKTYAPHLVWIDVQMPVMDGIEASALMRVHERVHGRRPARIIAISGLSSELGSHASVLASGQIDVWLTKGGPTLKTLAAGLVEWAAELARPPEGETVAPPPPEEDGVVLASLPERGTVLASLPEDGTELVPPGDMKKVAPPVHGTEVATSVAGTELPPPHQDKSELATPPKHGTDVARPLENGTDVAQPLENGTVLATPPEDGTVLASPVDMTEVAPFVNGTDVAPPPKDGMELATPPTDRTALTTPVDGTELAPPVDTTKVAPPVNRTEVATPVGGAELAPLVDMMEAAPPMDGMELATPPEDGTEITPPVNGTVLATPWDGKDVATPVDGKELAAE